jgi:hypothetical protein
MTTTAAISPVIRNVLSVAKIPPIAMNASQMARITPRIVHIIRPMDPVCARRPAQGLSANASTTGLPDSRTIPVDAAASSQPERWCRSGRPWP